jgi:hypothetical protein
MKKKRATVTQYADERAEVDANVFNLFFGLRQAHKHGTIPLHKLYMDAEAKLHALESLIQCARNLDRSFQEDYDLRELHLITEDISCTCLKCQYAGKVPQKIMQKICLVAKRQGIA